MKRMRFYMMLAMVCCAVVSVRAQGHGWVQYSFSGAYENFAHTFENSGYTLTVEAEGFQADYVGVGSRPRQR